MVLPSSVRASRLLAAIAAPTLSMFFVGLTAQDIEHVRIAARRAVDPTFCGTLETIRFVSTLLVSLLLILLIVAATRRPSWRLRRIARGHRSAAPMLALGMTMVSAVAVGLISTQHPQFIIPAPVVIVVLIVAALSFLTVGVLIMWGQPKLQSTAPPE